MISLYSIRKSVASTTITIVALGTLALSGCENETSSADAKNPISTQTSQNNYLAELANLVSAEDVTPAAPLSIKPGALKKRETLIDVLDRLGADRKESNRAVYAAANHIDMRRLRPGQGVTAYFQNDDTAQLTALSFKPDAERQVLVSKSSAGDWVSRELKVKLHPDFEKVGGVIDTSIYDLALKQGAGDQQVVDFAEIFAYDVDFQREIRQGDTFEIAYEVFRDELGNTIKKGDVLYASLNGKKVSRNFYRYTTSDDGITDYYDDNGKAARKFLMKTPINGARLSSSFGKRRHPVLGYTKVHKGTDFAAPRGTPIYAAGNGVVERASRYGSYGNYVRIRHADGYKTAYAHMNGYGKGIKSGVRVKQGQIIGYVGTTGRSTGPHLHYEVQINGKHVDAMRLKLPTGRTLSGEMLEKFKIEKARIDAIRTSHELPILLADAS
ncbi:M23 family metallopeptidase [Hirschia baltica]|uniref:Peptidase M23 n=1 Tax=Hirschia baltica (strain ATCC 49814 / DSM 5838 / IFAM 1418) TaxID=582402 RepID=C6XL13_HIRBI|nr:M23 family metallopeptidase [Hirschia baltica]ACT57842.1 Peptidase M23 [Hirschia baltica ATCC 49814]